MDPHAPPIRDELLDELVDIAMDPGDDIYGDDGLIRRLEGVLVQRLAGPRTRQGQRRGPLDPPLDLDAFYCRVRDDAGISQAVYITLGMTVDGKRDVVNLWVQRAAG